MFGLFEKKEHQLLIDGKAEVTLKPKETLLNGALRHDIAFPYSCRVGGCGSCKCQLIKGKVKELTDKSYLLSKQEIGENYILGCQSIPKSDVVIKLPSHSFAQLKTTGVIVSQKTLTHDISEVIIRLEKPVPFQAGQYANIKAIGTNIPERSYSFAHRFSGKEISFFVRLIPNGRMSNWLFDSNNINHAVELNGPMGDFYYRDSDRAMVCVAGGSGLAPIISLLEEAVASSLPIKRRRVLLLMGARTLSDLYYVDEIERIRNQWEASFEYKAVLSEEPETSDWLGARGMVTDYLNEFNCTDAQAYLCGPPPMIDAAIAKMKRFGLSVEHIYFDKFLDQSQVA